MVFERSTVHMSKCARSHITFWRGHQMWPPQIWTLCLCEVNALFVMLLCHLLFISVFWFLPVLTIWIELTLDGVVLPKFDHCLLYPCLLVADLDSRCDPVYVPLLLNTPILLPVPNFCDRFVGCFNSVFVVSLPFCMHRPLWLHGALMAFNI